VRNGTYARQVSRSGARATGGVPFVKGHGTGNDFLIVPDLPGVLTLSAEWVSQACARHTGLGADGVIRVVRSGADPSLSWGQQGDFVMDYRNADGSLAEMCGNGARVMLRYLAEQGLVGRGPVSIATRGGLRTGWVEGTNITIDMGLATAGPNAEVLLGGHVWTATGVFLPNPHAVVVVEDFSAVGDLTLPPQVRPASSFPDGVNVEFVVREASDRLRMRVHERGVGETMACGTGACAVAWAVGALQDGAVEVEQPGGVVHVRSGADGELLLTGPAVLIASGELAPSGVADESLVSSS